MSLHVTTSPSAQSALKAQKRKTTVTSLIIALLSLILIGLILYVISIAAVFKDDSPLVSYQSSSDNTEPVEKPETNNQVSKKPSPPSSNMAKVIASQALDEVSIPVMDIALEEPSVDFGDGDDFGDGWGSTAGNNTGGDGGAASAFHIPSSMQKRCSKKDRLERLRAQGGSPTCEDAVVKALRWLQQVQADEGYWGSTRGRKVEYHHGITGLALLAYLGHCETPNSPEFGQTVEKAIIFLVNQAIQNDGQMTAKTTNYNWIYEQAICCYALAEAYTLCSEFNIDIPNLDQAVILTGNLILDSQHKSGGWDYDYDKVSKRGGDLSIAAWHMQAIKACKFTKLKFDHNLETAAKKGIRYIETCQRAGGNFKYKSYDSGSNNADSLTGAGILCLQQWGKGSRSAASKGLRFLLKNTTFSYKKSGDLYRHYYDAQAMLNEGGKHWDTYNQVVMPKILEAQSPNGSWPKPGGTFQTPSFSTKKSIAPVYRTTLCVLMLEVYYRFLPSDDQ